MQQNIVFLNIMATGTISKSIEKDTNWHRALQLTFASNVHIKKN